MATLYQRRQLRRLSREEHDAEVKRRGDSVVGWIGVLGLVAFVLWQIVAGMAA